MGYENCSWCVCLLFVFLCCGTLLAVTFALSKVLIVILTWRKRRDWGYDGRHLVVGFFHPYCNAGGGGERVLWQAVHALQGRYPLVRCVIYTGDTDASSKEILNKAHSRFGITLSKEDQIHFVYLKLRKWVEATRWPRFTLLGQSVGSMLLGMEALVKLCPDVYIDSMGYAFTLPLFRWLGSCKVASYVHYPVVSCDMIDKVSSRQASHNNAAFIGRSRLLTNLKLYYYRFFAKLYGAVGRCNNVAMVNSSWTRDHIARLWSPATCLVIYPPCDTSAFQQLPLARSDKVLRIASVAQFRPEKDHLLQLKVLAELVQTLPSEKAETVRLVLIGSCRHEEDQHRVQDLKREAERLGISNQVDFLLNISYAELQKELGRSLVALHTMWNEHFGISVVECMAAGCVMVAHDSAGPAMDIVVDWEGKRTGYLAKSTAQFVSCITEALQLTEHERLNLVAAARESVQRRFSIQVFEDSFLQATELLFVH